ncbi:hypothetical protein Nans01_37170 [Nocardiopsis ansamitocini]|uniref:Uncharacterized protein n=1 Tax=Nocardiopsis ansamitocini TaxID=1670832 RepID=A0A9W6UHY4_9ACTN|nr:hypothetical protein Nans01_37170 [Nocardiopsis ansamitocini]
MDVEQDEVGLVLDDDADRAVDVAGLADDLYRVAEFAAHTAAKEPVVVHDDDARDPPGCKGVFVYHGLDSTLAGSPTGARCRTRPPPGTTADA